MATAVDGESARDDRADDTGRRCLCQRDRRLSDVATTTRRATSALSTAVRRYAIHIQNRLKIKLTHSNKSTKDNTNKKQQSQYESLYNKN